MQDSEAPTRSVALPASLSAVTVTYPHAARSAPREASLSINPGERVLLLGPSACGKSSLSMTINGLVPRSVPARVSGDIRVHGKPVSESTVAELSRQVGMVFQDVDAQIVMDTAFDEVAFGPENLRFPEAEVVARTEHALQRVGLWGRRFDNPTSLSGGQKQRLAIACSLAMGAPLLVLDEPTANLDPTSIESTYAALGELTADGEHSVLLIEHNIDAALSLVNRIVVLDHSGHTRFDGTPETVLGRHGAQIAALGIRMPAPTRVGLALRDQGIDIDALPTRPDELRRLIAAHAPAVQSLLAHRSDTRDRPTATPASEQPAIEIKKMTTRRGKHLVLDDASLTIQPGEFVGIAGVNGSGKTTLIQTIAGLLRPTRGVIRVFGIDQYAKRRAARNHNRIGYVFQNPEHQFVTDTVAGELAISLMRSVLTEPERQQLIDQQLERFGLVDARERHPFLLSGGQKRRLSVATALITGADILLLDEPTFGQDQAYSDELMRVLGDLHQSGTTILMVSHDLDLISQHTQRTVLVADGGIHSAMTTGNTFADPALLHQVGLRPPAMDATLRASGAPAGTLATLVRRYETR